jgi:hypothetical protein
MHTKETKLKITNTLKGRKRSIEHIQKQKRSRFLNSKIQEGTIFNNLQVIRESTIEERKYGRRTYLCKCLLCGNCCFIIMSNLKGNRTKSCGCLVKKPIGIAALETTYTRYIRGAKKRNLEFSLTLDEFKEITSSICYYCGSLPNTTAGKGHNGDYIHNGIDRINNKEGYTKENSVACCPVCNYMKNKLDINTFLNKVELIYNYIIKNSKKVSVDG